MQAGVFLDSDCDQRRIEAGLGDPVDRGDGLGLAMTAAQNEQPVRNHQQCALFGILIHLGDPPLLLLALLLLALLLLETVSNKPISPIAGP